MARRLPRPTWRWGLGLPGAVLALGCTAMWWPGRCPSGAHWVTTVDGDRREEGCRDADDEWHGVYQRYEGERLVQRISWAHGERHGKYETWGPFDRRAEGYYKAGKRDGPYRVWHHDGTLFIEGLWIDGEPHGVHSMWNHTGQLVVREHWNRGEHDGTAFALYGDGTMRSRAFYVDDQPRTQFAAISTVAGEARTSLISSTARAWSLRHPAR